MLLMIILFSFAFSFPPPPGVEPTGSNAMALSLREGERVQLSRVDAFADG